MNIWHLRLAKTGMHHLSEDVMVMFKAKEMPKTVPVADGDDVEKRPENVLINVLKEQDYPETTQKTTQKTTREKLPGK